MAVYKVPQDVEADDKLLGPFSFRQFVYLIIVAGSAFIGWVLAQLFIPLAVIVLPVIIFFGALALPLRKDQPMETYLAAIVSFYIKPRRRIWSPDGTQSLVEITVPKVVETKRTKDLSEDEAERRLSYLASIVDSRGWAVRGIQPGAPATQNSMNSDAYYEAQTATDVLDDTTGVGYTLEAKLEQADARHRQEMIARMHTPQPTAPAPTTPVPQAPPVAAPQPQAQQVAPATPPATLQPQPTATPQTDTPSTPSTVTFNPYPNMQQSVINPVAPTPATPTPQAPPVVEQETPMEEQPEKPSEKALSADIINLANNPDLSVETIAREANRIHEKEKLSENEVVISLR